jgi:putative hydrolase of the HAD superfamily
VPLLLLDLDNTLLDRAGPFRTWGERFLAEIGAPAVDIDWLLSIADGLTNRWAWRTRSGTAMRCGSPRSTWSRRCATVVEYAADRWSPARADRRRRRLGAGGGQQRRVANRTPDPAHRLDRYVADWVIPRRRGQQPTDLRSPHSGAAALRLGGGDS